MVEDIPRSQKWEISIKVARAVPLIYDIFFKKEFNPTHDENKQLMYFEVGKAFKDLALALDLPLGNVRDIHETFSTILSILTGLEFTIEDEEVTEDKSVSKVTVCPILNKAKEMNLDPEKSVQTTCRAHTKSIIEHLNHKCTHYFNKTMCEGDPYCESVIEYRE